MARKLFTQMGMWAGLQIPGISIESNAASDLAQSSSITEPLDKTLQDSFRSPFNECCVSAQRNLNFAIERGAYFAHRMPDWALGFKTKTTDILNTRKQSSLIAKHYRDKRYDYKGSEYSFVCRKDSFENSALGYFDKSEAFNQGATNNIREPEPLKPLKIKDDITCRKRQSIAAFLVTMIVDLVVRTGVVVAVIMATKHYGIWDSPERTQELYSSTSEHVEPYAENARRRMGIDPPQPPPEGQWKFFGVHYYNQVVISVFSLLTTVPELLGQGLELVPGYANKMYQGAKQQYEKYREKSQDDTKKESCQRKCMDQTPSVVQPIEPDPHHSPSCKRKDMPDKVIEPPPKKRFEDDFIYKPRLPSKEAKAKCNCTKCKRREEEGWSDNKPKCPSLAPPDNNTDNKEQPSKKQVCKLCPRKDSMETGKCNSEAETLKTCKKCLANQEH